MDKGNHTLIDDTLKKQILKYESGAIVHPLVQKHFTRALILANLTEELDADISKGTDVAFAESFSQRCPVPGAVPADYMLRKVEIEPGFTVLAGIRFRNLDLNFPFVAAVHRNAGFLSEEQLHKVMRRMSDEFSLFAPKAFLYYDSSNGRSFTPESKAIDKRILMGSIAAMAAVSSGKMLRVEQAQELDFYDRYKQEYEIVSKKSPEYLQTETAEREEDMQNYVKNNLTYKVFIDNSFAGVFIAQEITTLGAKGYYVNENLLFEEFRGRKLSSSVQSAVAKRLLALGGKLLLGSIYRTNLPAYNAALSSQRIDVGGTYLVPMS